MNMSGDRQSVYKFQGFTLIELLITFTIAVILILVAVPGFRQIIQNNQIATVADEWITVLNFAKSEAIRRKRPVSICPAADPEIALCNDSSSWKKGWIVFIDPNANGNLSTLQNRLEVRNAITASINFVTNSGRVTFSSLGQVISGAGDFKMTASDCIGNTSKIVTLSSSGAVRSVNTSCP